jgi:hypothetical protein
MFRYRIVRALLVCGVVLGYGGAAYRFFHHHHHGHDRTKVHVRCG